MYFGYIYTAVYAVSAWLKMPTVDTNSTDYRVFIVS